MDHLCVETAFPCKKPVTPYPDESDQKTERGPSVARQTIRFRRLQYLGDGGVGLWQSRRSSPQFAISLCSVFTEWQGRKIRLQQGFVLQADQLRPKSRGEIKLHS